MKRILLISLVSLFSTAGAVSISALSPGFETNFAGPDRPSVDFTLNIPAAFPKAAERHTLSYNCEDGFGGPTSDAAATNMGVQVTSGGMAVEELKVSCDQNKLTLFYPKMMSFLTISTPGVDGLKSALEDRHLSPIVWSSKRDGLGWAVRSNKFIIFAIKNGRIKVVRGTPGQGAVALSQGGAPQPLWVYGSPSKTVSIDLRKPFSLHYSGNNGAEWSNLTVNPTADTLSLWSSVKLAGGPASSVNK